MNVFDLVNEDECCACFSCYNICPKNAIYKKLDDNGFIVFKSSNECVSCGLCIKVCPLINNEIKSNNYERYFMGWSKDDNIRIKSSSGGLFYEIAKKIIEKKGYVCCVGFDDITKVRHIIIDNVIDLKKNLGSKYLQSYVNDAYIKVGKLLSNNNIVLFSGTPCQISGLYLYLYLKKIDIEHLYTCEVICHGVPSYLVYYKYLKYLKELFNASPIKINFRNKYYGWQNYSVFVLFSNKKKYSSLYYEDPFMVGYLNNLYLRDICYRCPFAKLPRVADITLGDFWGCKEKHSYGISLLILNSKKGIKLVRNLSNVDLKEVNKDVAIRYNNRILCGFINKNKKEKQFYIDLKNKSFDFIIKKYLKPKKNYYRKINDKLYHIIHYTKLNMLLTLLKNKAINN